MEYEFHGNRLRAGRYSEPNRIYHVTTVTHLRKPTFVNLYAARSLIQILRTEHNNQVLASLAYVLMPDHLHWLFQLGSKDSLTAIVGRVKSLTARSLGERVWQAGFHDHAVRREEDLVTLARYIVANPIRAGLVRRVGDYPHWDAVWL